MEYNENKKRDLRQLSREAIINVCHLSESFIDMVRKLPNISWNRNVIRVKQFKPRFKIQNEKNTFKCLTINERTFYKSTINIQFHHEWMNIILRAHVLLESPLKACSINTLRWINQMVEYGKDMNGPLIFDTHTTLRKISTVRYLNDLFPMNVLVWERKWTNIDFTNYLIDF